MLALCASVIAIRSRTLRDRSRRARAASSQSRRAYQAHDRTRPPGVLAFGGERSAHRAWKTCTVPRPAGLGAWPREAVMKRWILGVALLALAACSSPLRTRRGSSDRRQSSLSDDLISEITHSSSSTSSRARRTSTDRSSGIRPRGPRRVAARLILRTGCQNEGGRQPKLMVPDSATCTSVANRRATGIREVPSFAYTFAKALAARQRTYRAQHQDQHCKSCLGFPDELSWQACRRVFSTCLPRMPGKVL